MLRRFALALTPRHRSDDEKRLGACGNGCGQRRIRPFVREIPFAGKKANVGATLLRDVIAYRPAQHRIAGLERVEQRPLRCRAVEIYLDLAVNTRKRSQMRRKHDPDHGSV